ncbi:MAG: hypothetical protein OER21_15305 [Gemmatimonadota bacterium]|nr:hypothetical protein [Gemmatimonadota bacterium]
MNNRASPTPLGAEPGLRTRLTALCDEGWEIWSRFDTDVRQHAWHPFVAADYECVLHTLLTLRAPGGRFLEWGSAHGVITIMADLLGFEAYGIELDATLVRIARELADRYESRARFAAGSFLPGGYQWNPRSGDTRLGTIGQGTPAYAELGHPLEDFDVVFAFPWTGEEPMMHDVMRRYGGRAARLLLYGVSTGVEVYCGGRREG